MKHIKKFNERFFDRAIKKVSQAENLQFYKKVGVVVD